MTHTPNFDSIKQVNPYGMEYWSARDLMPLLGYGKKWQNFEEVIKKAMTACIESGNIVEQHFTDASKSSPMPHGGARVLVDYHLSRFSCYLIAQNGDPRKPEKGLQNQQLLLFALEDWSGTPWLKPGACE